jgi:hypothetical protein
MIRHLEALLRSLRWLRRERYFFFSLPTAAEENEAWRFA